MQPLSVRRKLMESQGGVSAKLLTSFVIFVAGREVFQLYTNSSGWVASLIGLALWAIVMYAVPPRPKPWKLFLGTASLAILIVLLRLLRFN